MEWRDIILRGPAGTLPAKTATEEVEVTTVHATGTLAEAALTGEISLATHKQSYRVTLFSPATESHSRAHRTEEHTEW